MDALLDIIPPKLVAYIPGLETRNYYYTTGQDVIDVSKASFWFTFAAILFNPIYWNIIARNEYRNKTLQKILGSPYAACYFLAVTIFSLGIFRDGLYERCLREQPHYAGFATPAVKYLAITLFLTGQLFVVTSIYALGITGTYLGDYCGILMKERVTCFPFNVLEDPMYVGSTLAFLGTALWFESPAGVVLSAVVWIVYSIALKYEGPFTGMIYSTAAKKAEDAKRAAPATPPRVAASSRVNGATGATNGETRRRSARQSALPSDNIESSPMRVTRSRSKARGSGEESN